MSRVTRCPVCGAFVGAEDRFCWSCGAELGRGDSAPEPPLVRDEGDPEVRLAVRRAYLAQQRGDLTEAERILRDALERHPDDVSALSLFSEVLRAKGDAIGAVSAAQRATEVADGAPPGAVRTAREERARIEAQVVREVRGPARAATHPLALLASPGPPWYRSGRFYAGLAVVGAMALLLALTATLQGRTIGYAWFAVSLLAAGWAYNDAETRRMQGLFWGVFVLLLGPFGVAVYLLATH